jgi:hypothetical protein
VDEASCLVLADKETRQDASSTPDDTALGARQMRPPRRALRREH